MKIRFVFMLLAVTSFGVCGVQGQQANPKNVLTEMQKQGQRLFQQRCSVCHTSPAAMSPLYGPQDYCITHDKWDERSQPPTVSLSDDRTVHWTGQH